MRAHWLNVADRYGGLKTMTGDPYRPSEHDQQIARRFFSDPGSIFETLALNKLEPHKSKAPKSRRPNVRASLEQIKRKTYAIQVG